MLNIYFFQCQESYGKNIYLPYSSGILWSYVSQFPFAKKKIKLKDIFFEKKKIEEYIEALDNPDVLLFSNYGWNTAYHIEIAKQSKKKFPDCKIIIGGPNAQQSEKYLRDHPYVDISVWGEGEQTLHDIFLALTSKKSYHDVPGIACISDDVYYKTETRKRNTCVNDFPSPYLSGVFDSFFERYKHYNFMPVWETNRGCPYHCTFCDLGADYYNKLYEFDTERLLEEIKWFSDKKIEYIEVADANFGILPRDLDLVKVIKKLHDETGYPQKINATWAKNSPDRVFEASKILESMNRGGVTLALQSQNKVALGNIKRINIANERLEMLTKKYIENDIQTYHDFILGLPGETLESWKQGLIDVVNINPEGWIFGHPLEAYENTEFSDPEYIKEHKLKFATTPQVSFFALRNKDIPVETGKYVISHKTMTQEEYIEAFLFKWFLITVHSMGWANYTGKVISKKLGSKLGDFYLALYKWMLDTPNSVLAKEYLATKEALTLTLKKKEFWGRQMFGDDDIYWEYESASNIVIEQNRNTYFDELKTFVSEVYGGEFESVVDMNDLEVISFIREYPYKVKEKKLLVETDIEDVTEWKQFCEEIYWKGRRIRKWKTKVTYVKSK